MIRTTPLALLMLFAVSGCDQPADNFEAPVASSAPVISKKPEPPAPLSPDSVVISWTFPNDAFGKDLTCSDAGATWMDVQLDDGEVTREYCSTRTLVRTVTPGEHRLTVMAFDDSGGTRFQPGTGLELYRQAFTFTKSTASMPLTVPLEWAVGSVAIKWAFFNNTIQQTCAEAWVSDVYVNLATEDGTLVFADNDGAGVNVPCVTPIGAQGVELAALLAPGRYAVYVQAITAAGDWFHSNQTTPPNVNVIAGQFPRVLAPQTSTVALDFPQH